MMERLLVSSLYILSVGMGVWAFSMWRVDKILCFLTLLLSIWTFLVATNNLLLLTP